MYLLCLGHHDGKAFSHQSFSIFMEQKKNDKAKVLQGKYKVTRFTNLLCWLQKNESF